VDGNCGMERERERDSDGEFVVDTKQKLKINPLDAVTSLRPRLRWRSADQSEHFIETEAADQSEVGHRIIYRQ